MKKYGITMLTLGIIGLAIGFVMLDSYDPYDYWGKSDGLQTIMELAPFAFITLGSLGSLLGAIFVALGMKPTVKRQVKIIEKNGNAVIAEFEDGTRKNLVVFGATAFVAGDVGMASCKGDFLVEFNKGSIINVGVKK